MLCSHPIAGRRARPCSARVCFETLMLHKCVTAIVTLDPAALRTGSASSSVWDRGFSDNGAGTGQLWPGHFTLSVKLNSAVQASVSMQGRHWESQGRQTQCAAHSAVQAQLELQNHTFSLPPNSDNSDAPRTGDAGRPCRLPPHTCRHGSSPRHAEAVGTAVSQPFNSCHWVSKHKQCFPDAAKPECWVEARQSKQTHLLAWQQAPSC